MPEGFFIQQAALCTHFMQMVRCPLPDMLVRCRSVWAADHAEHQVVLI